MQVPVVAIQLYICISAQVNEIETQNLRNRYCKYWPDYNFEEIPDKPMRYLEGMCQQIVHLFVLEQFHYNKLELESTL